MNKIMQYLNDKSNEHSLNLLKDIQNKIQERSFHLSGHIVYDLIDLHVNKKIVYAEIGSYCGASASLALSNKKTSEIFCIDPLNLPKEHYGGKFDQERTLRENLSKIDSDAKINILKNYSNDWLATNSFKNKKIDVLYIDGDHRFNGVLLDWINYKDFISSEGFIVFDDYYDSQYSPDVRKAVDYIVRNELCKNFDALGCPDNSHNIKFHRRNNIDKNGSFIFKRKQYK